MPNLLPLENDVPLETIRLLPQDASLDKIEMQKHTTPVPIAKSVEEAAEMIETKKINAVVNERSTEDEVDINARSTQYCLTRYCRIIK